MTAGFTSCPSQPTGQPGADHHIAASATGMLKVGNYIPITGWTYRSRETFSTAWWVHTGAEQHRYDLRGPVGDARIVHDNKTNLYYVTQVGRNYTTGLKDSWVIGIGTDDPTNIWHWTVIPWDATNGDGARVAFSDTEIFFSGVGNMVRCNKGQLILGASAACSYVGDSLSNRVPVLAADGTVGAGYLIGFAPTLAPQPAQLYTQTVGGAPTAVLYGDLTPWNTPFTAHTPLDTLNFTGITLKDAVAAADGTVWVSFQGTCPWSGPHACVGAASLFVTSSYSYLESIYWFDAPGNGWDGTLPAMSVTRSGYPMLTWVATSPGNYTSMAIGSITPQGGLGNTHNITTWTIAQWGDGAGPYAIGYGTPDFLGIDCLQPPSPYTNLCVAHGIATKVDLNSANYVCQPGQPNHCYTYLSFVEVFAPF